jgi:predicted AlkP superfamily phosphohydrolase/phosphomutase
VAWSSFATGKNPGEHGIFDFLRRDPALYRPDLALNRYEQKNAFTPPRAVNLRRGEPIWTILGEAGVASEVIRCPCTYPPDRLRGHLISGMGVPDLKGGLGTSTFYTSNSSIVSGESERVVVVAPEASGRVTSSLLGPRSPKDRQECQLPFSVEPEPGGSTAIFRCSGASPPDLRLELGRWTDWIRVKFKLGLFQTVRGLVRLRLLKVGSDFQLYASPINFDPDAPLFPISEPAEYASELARAIGPYYTTGMVEDHAGLSNRRIDEAGFLDQCEIAWTEREAMMLQGLSSLDEGLFYCLFDTPDRIQHMFWRFLEPDHPANRALPYSEDYAHIIEQTYRRADSMVGKALEYADDSTLMIALSDHGFGSFRRCVDLNGWLLQHGFLTLKPGCEPSGEGTDLLQGIDWSRTRAYAVGLGGLYLNLKGREGNGTVDPGDAERLTAEIAQGLTTLTDPDSGQAAIRRVTTREETYHGPYVEEAPDLLVHYHRGYRVSWETGMGGVSRAVVSDNTNAWSGDHIVDPELVPGVLFLDRPFSNEGPDLRDLAPTILSALGVPVPKSMEGKDLL